MARDNPRWGYTRIRGALHDLGHEIARNTIKRILLENGFDPIRKTGRLRHAVQEYTEHHHIERNHQGLDSRLIEERQGTGDMNCAVVRHERLGGVLNYYDRRAA